MNTKNATKMTRYSHRILKTNRNQQEILDKLQQLQQQLDEIKEFVLQNDTKPVRKRKVKMLTPEDYQTFFSWQEKIIFILKYRKKPLLSYEIVSFMNDFDTVFQFKWTELDKVKILSTHLNRAIKRGVIIRHKQNGVRGYYYSIPEV